MSEGLPYNGSMPNLVDDCVNIVVKEELPSVAQLPSFEGAVRKDAPFREDFGVDVRRTAGVVAREDG